MLSTEKNAPKNPENYEITRKIQKLREILKKILNKLE